MATDDGTKKSGLEEMKELLKESLDLENDLKEAREAAEAFRVKELQAIKEAQKLRAHQKKEEEDFVKNVGQAYFINLMNLIK